MSLTATDRRRIREAIDVASRAGLGPNARPGHPSRFVAIQTVVNRGHKVIRPSLTYYDEMPPSKPRIFRHLNG